MRDQVTGARAAAPVQVTFIVVPLPITMPPCRTSKEEDEEDEEGADEVAEVELDAPHNRRLC